MKHHHRGLFGGAIAGGIGTMPARTAALLLRLLLAICLLTLAALSLAQELVEEGRSGGGGERSAQSEQWLPAFNRQTQQQQQQPLALALQQRISFGGGKGGGGSGNSGGGGGLTATDNAAQLQSMMSNYLNTYNLRDNNMLGSYDRPKSPEEELCLSDRRWWAFLLSSIFTFFVGKCC